ncbi:preprotein translocase subunit SecE [bacterium]|nr:preprotein translocase subunit SecE [bacterium]
MAEVVVELSRVSWPTQKETQAATVMVVIMVLLSGAFLGFLDYLWTVMLKWII